MPEPAAVTPANLPKLSERDLLRVENLTIKLHNVAMQTRQIQLTAQQELQKAIASQNALVKEFDELVKEYSGRYGVDITKVDISTEGQILGPKPTLSPVPQGS